jgi:hypothetical protein
VGKFSCGVVVGLMEEFSRSPRLLGHPAFRLDIRTLDATSGSHKTAVLKFQESTLFLTEYYDKLVNLSAKAYVAASGEIIIL